MSDKYVYPLKDGDRSSYDQHGLTIRDYFAARVMEAMLGSNWTLKDEEIPSRAYKLADLMMKAREA